MALLRTTRAIAGILLINAGVLILLFLGAELCCRTLCYCTGRGFFRESRFTSPWFSGYDPPRPIECANGCGTFRHRTKPTPKHKPTGTYRIITVGGSTTANELPWARGGGDYALHLERILNEGDTGIAYEVLNAGGEAYSTAHSAINIALRLVEYGPDLIILMHNVNDSSVLAFSDGPRADYGNKYLQPAYLNPALQSTLSLEGILYQSRLLCYCGLPQRLARRTLTLNGHRDVEYGLSLFRRNLRTISGICRVHGISLLLLTQPHEARDNEYVRLDTIRRYNRAILQEATHNHDHAFDMAVAFGNRPGSFVDGIHYAPHAVRRFAQILAPTVEAIAVNTWRR